MVPITSQVLTTNILQGSNYKDATGVLYIGTMANRGTWNLANAFPGVGYYAGVTGSPTASQLCSGLSIAGIHGTAVCEDSSATSIDATLAPLVSLGTVLYDSAGATVTGTLVTCSANGQTNCVNPSSFLAGTPAAANSNGANGVLVLVPPAGYYNGTTKTVTASDTNLTVGNIKFGVSLFGVTGTAIAESGTTVSGATAADMISGKEAWDNAGAKLTGTMANNGNLNVANTWPGVGYYGATPSGAPTAAQICNGTSVLGIAGLAGCPNSNVHRNQAAGGGNVMSQVAETTTYAGVGLPGGYREVPTIATDDDGYVSVGVTSSLVTLSTRPTGNCGTTQNTVSARITECASINGAAATWDGKFKANAGQGIWKLVTRAAANKEVWQDQRTGLLWSSVVTTSDSWCRAAGNAEAGDPSNYCNSVSYQPSYPIAESWCAEVGPTSMAEAAGSSETWSTGTYASAKGGMGKTSTASSPSVRWRLPTRYDYQMADINGIRFVMPEMVTTGSGPEWTASVYSFNRGFAWVFTGSTGLVTVNACSGTLNARCVGR